MSKKFEFCKNFWIFIFILDFLSNKISGRLVRAV